MHTYEQVGESFSLDKFLLARRKSIEIVKSVAKKIVPGMREEDSYEILNEELNKYKSEKLWHPSKIRFGKNTICQFKEKSQENTVLQDNDVFFLDIGPVFDGHEADFGETFYVGNDSKYEQIANSSKEIFFEIQEELDQRELTGQEIYELMGQKAKALGFELNMKMEGHRLGDFPHHIYYRGGLKEIDFVPCDNLWILEVHLISSCKNYGAFYEDILVRSVI